VVSTADLVGTELLCANLSALADTERVCQITVVPPVSTESFFVLTVCCLRDGSFHRRTCRY
jgi:hypothetical protein